MKRLLIAAAVFAAAVVSFVLLTLRPPRLRSRPRPTARVRGILHVHTNRSDGRSTPEEVAAVAARAGVAFIVFTDHGDGTRPPDPPTYRSGVLCLDGVEISTAGGHYFALDMPASPYPLAGEARDVVEDVRRLGGFGIAAHPDSPKPELRWSDWDAPIDAVEWVNPDTSWRVRAASGWRVALQPAARAASLSDQAERNAGEPADGLRGHDVPLEQPWPNGGRSSAWPVPTRTRSSSSATPIRGTTRFSIPLPGYEASLQMLSVHVAARRPAVGRRRGRCRARHARDSRGASLYGHRRPRLAACFRVHRDERARNGARQATSCGVGGPVTLRVRSNAPAGFTTIIWRGAEALTSLASEGQGELSLEAGAEPAVYRAEIRNGDSARGC